MLTQLNVRPYSSQDDHSLRVSYETESGAGIPRSSIDRERDGEGNLPNRKEPSVNLVGQLAAPSMNLESPTRNTLSVVTDFQCEDIGSVYFDEAAKQLGDELQMSMNLSTIVNDTSKDLEADSTSSDHCGRHSSAISEVSLDTSLDAHAAMNPNEIPVIDLVSEDGEVHGK